MKVKNIISLLIGMMLGVAILFTGCAYQKAYGQVVYQMSYEDYVRQTREAWEKAGIIMDPEEEELILTQSYKIYQEAMALAREYSSGNLTKQQFEEQLESKGRQYMLDLMKAGAKEEVDPEIERLIQELGSPNPVERARAARDIGTLEDSAIEWVFSFLLKVLKDHYPINAPGTKYYEYFPLQEPPWKLWYEVQSDFEAHYSHVGSDSSHHLLFFSYLAVSLRDGTNYWVPAGSSIPVPPNFITSEIGIEIEDYFIDPEIPEDFKMEIEKLFLSNPPTGLKPPGMSSVSFSAFPVLTDYYTIKFFIYARCGPPITSPAEQALESILKLGKIPIISALVNYLPLRYEDYVEFTKEGWKSAGMDVDPKMAKDILSIEGWRNYNKGRELAIEADWILPRLMNCLIDCLRNESPEVRKGAAWNLGRLDIQYATPGKTQEYSQQLKDLESKAVMVLSQLLKDENAQVRGSAAEALKKITGKDFGQDPVE